MTIVRTGWNRRITSENTTVLPSPVGSTISADVASFHASNAPVTAAS